MSTPQTTVFAVRHPEIAWWAFVAAAVLGAIAAYQAGSWDYSRWLAIAVALLGFGMAV
jgi:hypothetical protein